MADVALLIGDRDTPGSGGVAFDRHLRWISIQTSPRAYQFCAAVRWVDRPAPPVRSG
jgi:hypothetical protein